MVNLRKCVQYTIIGIGMLDIILGLVVIGIGSIMLSSIDDDEDNELLSLTEQNLKSASESQNNEDLTKLLEEHPKVVAKLALKVIGIVLIISGIWSIIDGLIAVVGVLKLNKKLITIHVCLVFVYEFFYLYLICTNFSAFILGGFLLNTLCVVLAIQMMRYLKKDENETYQAVDPERFGGVDPKFGTVDPKFGTVDPKCGIVEPKYGTVDP
ncbi:hypothetical protein CHUAL_001296 [Chamberlinius hualienensis]